jgi:hypothetical protein
MVRYNKAGKYVAICNTTSFNGHYTKIFEYPQSFIDEWNLTDQTRGIPAPDASWYFLNRIDFVACLEAVYPIEIFEIIPEIVCDGIDLYRLAEMPK